MKRTCCIVWQMTDKVGKMECNEETELKSFACSVMPQSLAGINLQTEIQPPICAGSPAFSKQILEQQQTGMEVEACVEEQSCPVSAAQVEIRI